MWRTIWRSLRALFLRNRLERDMERELQFHLERETEANIARGMHPEEARRAARMNFGGVERFKEECREARRPRRLESFWQDVRFGVRILRRNPGYASIAMLTLALGIGANTAIFSVVYGVLLRPLPYEHGEQLLVLRQQAPLAGIDNMRFSVREIEDYRAQNQSLSGVVEHHSMSFTLFGGPEPERIQAGVVSHDFFDVMGVKPLLGRSFLPADEVHGAEAVLMLSYKYWQRSQKGDANIVGRVFRMNNRPHTVIGVLPDLPQYPNENDVYMPTSACPTRSSEGFITDRTARMMSAFGRLKSDVSIPQAQADITGIAGRLQQSYPQAYPENRGYKSQVASLHGELTKQARPTFLILFCTAGLVLLIACANVANLMLARLLRRERELALRAVLGAGRGRLMRQMLTESAMLSLAGGLVGLLLARWGLGLLVDFAARFTPRANEIGLDGPVLLTAFGISLLTGLFAGLIPALSIRENLATAIKEGGSQNATGAGWQRLRNALVVAQVAVSFTLLIGAGLMVRSLVKLQQVNPGFDPERVLALRVSPNWSKFTTGEHYLEFSKRLLEKVKSQPGVLSVALSSSYPLNPRGITQSRNGNTFQIEGRPLPTGVALPTADASVVSTDYFHTLRMPLVGGRLLNDMDHERAPLVTLINRSLARHHWPNEDPVGKRISFNGGRTWAQIVGVVGDVKQYGLDQAVADEIYAPLLQNGGAGNLLVRTGADPAGMLRQLRQSVYDIDAETAIDDVRTLEQAREESLASPRLTAALIGLFAVLALAITIAGITGVMALSVSQRTHEIGIRLALGANKSTVLWMVVGQGMKLILLGLVIGSLCALLLARLAGGWMTSLLFAVEPTDPLTFLATAALLALVAALACLAVARRVTGIDPIIALRSE